MLNKYAFCWFILYDYITMYSLKNTQNINQLVNYSFLFKMFLRNSYYVYTCVPQHGGCGGMSWHMEVA